MATIQELIEQWKKEAAQSQTVTGKEIPNIAMYQAQNEARREYNGNSALEREQNNKEFLQELEAQNQANNRQMRGAEINANRDALNMLMNMDVRSQGDLGVYNNAVKTQQAINNIQDQTARINELSDMLVEATKNAGMAWTLPGKMWNKTNPYLGLSDEDKAIIRNYIAANKGNQNMSEAEKATFRAFQTAAQRAGENLDIKSEELVNSMPAAQQKAFAVSEGFNDFFTPLAKAIGKAASPLIPGINVQSIDDAYATNQRYMNSIKERNPEYSNAGRSLGQMYGYAVTSPFVGGLAAKAGLGKGGEFALNQGVQLAQDLGLDIIPEAQRMLREEGKIDWGELLKRTAGDAAFNVLMNKAPDILQSLDKTEYENFIKALGDSAGNAKLLDNTGALKQGAENVADAFKVGRNTAEGANLTPNELFRQNINEGAEKLAKLNEQGYVPPQKYSPQEIASLNVNPVEANNKQFGELMDEFNHQFKDDSAMRNIFTPEDLEAAQKAQFDELMKGRPKTIADLAPDEIPEINTELPEIPSLKNVDDYSNMWKSADEIPEIAQNVQKPSIKERFGYIDLPEEVSEKGASDFAEIYDSLENMRKVAEASGDEKVMAKFNKLSKAVNDYENAFFKNESEDALISAKKATDAARQGFIREVKKTNPNYVGELTGTKVGNAAYRRTSMKANEQATQELVDSIIETEKDLNKNIHVQDAVPETQNPFKGVEADTTGPRPYAKNQSVSPSVENAAESLSKEMDNAAKTQQPKNLEIKELHDKKGRSRYQVVERISENMTQPVEAGKTYKTIDEANEAVYNLKNNVEGANPLQTFADGQPKEKWATSKARTNTFENQGWGEDLPKRDYAYKVYSEAEQNADAIARNQSYNDLIYKDSFDEVDVKAAMNQIQDLMDAGDTSQANRLAKKLAFEGREHGRGVQAFAEYNRNTASGAMRDAANVQEEIIQNWGKRNSKTAKGNSRIAKALADMGHKPISKEAANLTHDQIKQGVLTELEREVGSVEKYFNENDLEYLTTLAEDKSIPVWKITSEIEHKLKTGQWYSLDESISIPQPTNSKLQSALNSLVNDTVRAEKATPSLKEITEEVKNTLGKESADFSSQFSDDDVQYLANLINNGATKEELAEALNMKLATGSFGVKDETLQEVNNIFKEISNYDPNSKQFVEGQAKAYELLANDLIPNATPKEKFEAWRYIAMLGNPKTMLRNFVGNQTFNVVTGISNNIAAVAEAGVDKAIKAAGGEGIQRTKSVLNPLSDGSLIKAAAEDADASRYRQIIGSKYEKMDKNALRQSKSVFNSKLAKFYEKVTDAGISDYKAVKNKYSTSLAGYMKANGLDASAFDAEMKYNRLKNLSESRLLTSAEREDMKEFARQMDLLEKGRDVALKQAEYATFHEDNAIANVLSSWSRTSKEKGHGIGHILIEGMVPFKKTPANVLRSGFEYSPMGAIDSIRQTGKLIYENTGKRAGQLADTYVNSRGKEVSRTLASDVIDSWAKTLTGTGLTALGFYLYNKGILHSSDPDTKYQDQLEGHQNYAIEINGKSYTLDWAAPTIMPLMVGAEAAKIWNSTGKSPEDFYNNADAYIDAANKLADPLIETSMLSGVRDTVESAANYAKNNEMLNILPMLAYNLGTGYASQAVPTLAGQVARTVDNTRRSTYTDKEGIAGVVDKQLKKQMNKIPGLSMLNQPYVDTYGREQQNGPFDNPIGNLGYQMLSPGYLQNINETTADKVSREAYESSGNTNTLPQWKSSFKVDGSKVSPEEYTKASKIYGETQVKIREELANSEAYKNLSDADKETFMKKANTLAEKAAMEAIDPNFEPSKDYTTYKEGGMEALLNQQAGTDIIKEAGLSSSSNAAKEIKEAANNGDMEKAQKIAEKAGQVEVIRDKYDIPSNNAVMDDIREAIDKGNTTKAEQLAQDAAREIKAKAVPESKMEDYKAQLEKYELKDNDNTKHVYKAYGSAGVESYSKIGSEGISRYETARASGDTIPSLKEYAKTYSEIDSYGEGDSKNNKKVDQKEFAAYAQAKGLSQDEAREQAKLYGDEWKYIPTLQSDGSYKFTDPNKQSSGGGRKSSGGQAAKIYASAQAEGNAPAQAEFNSTYKAIDSYGTSNGRVTQAELISYGIANGMNEAQIQALARTYGDWTKIPVLQPDGTYQWKKVR